MRRSFQRSNKPSLTHSCSTSSARWMRRKFSRRSRKNASVENAISAPAISIGQTTAIAPFSVFTHATNCNGRRGRLIRSALQPSPVWSVGDQRNQIFQNSHLNDAAHCATLVALQFGVLAPDSHNNTATAIRSRRLVRNDGKVVLKAVHAHILALTNPLQFRLLDRNDDRPCHYQKTTYALSPGQRLSQDQHCKQDYERHA